MTETSRPAAAGTAGTGETQQGRAHHSATPRKWQRVLRAFLEGATLNRFEAYRELRDSCLNTTVSQIERRGVKILRREETVPGAFGPVHCCRYWLASESRQRARELLGLSEPSAELATRENAFTRAGESVSTLGSPTTDREGVVPTSHAADSTR